MPQKLRENFENQRTQIAGKMMLVVVVVVVVVALVVLAVLWLLLWSW